MLVGVQSVRRDRIRLATGSGWCGVRRRVPSLVSEINSGVRRVQDTAAIRLKAGLVVSIEPKQIHFVGIAGRGYNSVTVTAPIRAVVDVLHGSEIYEPPRTGPDIIAPVETRAAPVANADIHARVATNKFGDGELGAVRIISDVERRFDLRPVSAAIGGAPDTLLKRRSVDCA